MSLDALARRRSKRRRLEHYLQLRQFGVRAGEAAARLGVTVRTINRYEHDLCGGGDRRRVSYDDIAPQLRAHLDAYPALVFSERELARVIGRVGHERRVRGALRRLVEQGDAQLVRTPYIRGGRRVVATRWRSSRPAEPVGVPPAQKHPDGGAEPLLAYPGGRRGSSRRSRYMWLRDRNISTATAAGVVGVSERTAQCYERLRTLRPRILAYLARHPGTPVTAAQIAAGIGHNPGGTSAITSTLWLLHADGVAVPEPGSGDGEPARRARRWILAPAPDAAVDATPAAGANGATAATAHPWEDTTMTRATRPPGTPRHAEPVRRLDAERMPRARGRRHTPGADDPDTTAPGTRWAPISTLQAGSHAPGT